MRWRQVRELRAWRRATSCRVGVLGADERQESARRPTRGRRAAPACVGWNVWFGNTLHDAGASHRLNPGRRPAVAASVMTTALAGRARGAADRRGCTPMSAASCAARDLSARARSSDTPPASSRTRLRSRIASSTCRQHRRPAPARRRRRRPQPPSANRSSASKISPTSVSDSRVARIERHRASAKCCMADG